MDLVQIQTQLSWKNLVKYIIEGIAVAIASYLIPKRKTTVQEIAIIAFVASTSFFILDIFSEDVGKGTRVGTGFGIGMKLLNIPV